MEIQLLPPFSLKWNKGYLVINPENRRNIILYNSQTDRTTISYARYLMSVKLGHEIPDGYEVDHINNDKMDDCIENLQVLSKKENFNKSKKIKETIELVCPVCNKVFTFEKRNLSTHQNPCCSRRCGGIKSHW